jgi:hypothetical protein
LEAATAELGFRFSAPSGLSPVAEGALPSIDVSRLPGARVVTRLGWSDGAEPRESRTELFVLCAEAPSDRFAPGLEEMIFSYASSFARKQLEPTGLTLWHGRAPTSAEARYAQRVSAEGTRRAELVHVLGFVGPDHDAALCTLACVEPKEARVCDGLVDGATPVGAFVEAPPPNLIASAILGAAESPRTTLALVLLLAFAITFALVVKRPRPLP